MTRQEQRPAAGGEAAGHAAGFVVVSGERAVADAFRLGQPHLRSRVFQHL